MAKKIAFLLGCDSGGLKYCRSDAERFREVLSQLGYEIRSLTKEEYQALQKYKVQEWFDDFLEDCGSSDMVLFYYSGHGHTEKGDFKLILRDNLDQTKNQLSIDTIFSALKNCNAQDRLLIFDCCEAGKTNSQFDWQARAGEWCRILAATGRRGKALETDEGSAGLFTSWLCTALTGEVETLIDDNGCVTINRLHAHVREKAEGYISVGGKAAPIPGMYGDASKDIRITNPLKSPKKLLRILHLSVGYPAPLLEQLKSCLADLRPSKDLLERCFGLCRRLSRPQFNHFPVDNMGELIDFLADLYYLEANELPLPLISFMTFLADEINESAALSACLEKLKTALSVQGIPADIISAACESHAVGQHNLPAYLLVDVEPKISTGGYIFHYYRQDCRGDRYPLETDLEGLEIRQLPVMMNNWLLSDQLRDHEVILEIFLPVALLTEHQLLEDWECWTSPDDRSTRPRPLGTMYPMSLRCRDQIWRSPGQRPVGEPELRQYWIRRQRCLSSTLTPPCSRWLEVDDDQFAALDHLQKDALLLKFRRVPDTELICNLLDNGAALLLWPRHEALSDEDHEWLCQKLENQLLEDLPVMMRLIRQQRWLHSGHTRSAGLSLLWYDSDRAPGSDEPLAFPAED